MTENHTPGKWVAKTRHYEDMESRHHVISLDRYGEDRSGVAYDMTLGDARLIAAAPDLYEALKAARVHVEKYCHTQGDTREVFDDLLGPIDAALARAEGRE